MGYEITPWEWDPETDPGKFDFMLWDQTHFPVVWSILALSVHADYHPDSLGYAAEHFQLPTTRGLTWRLRDGAWYLCETNVTNPEEIKAREARFKEILGPYIGNFEQLWNARKEELTRDNKALQGLDLEKLTDLELRQAMDENIRIGKRSWFIHFEFLYPTAGLSLLFETTCKEMTGIGRSDPRFNKLFLGFENKAFASHREMWKLSRLALKLGLRHTFETTKTEDLLARLGTTESGRKWVTALREYLHEYGWRCERYWEIRYPGWIDDPTPVITTVTKLMAMPGEEYALDEARKKQIQEREAVEKELLAMIPSPEAKGLFKAFLNIAQKWTPYNEEHQFYIEDYNQSMHHRIFKEYGKRFHRAGAVENQEDIWWLTTNDIRKACFCPHKHDFRKLVPKRRQLWDRWAKADKPLIVGTPPSPPDPLFVGVLGYGVEIAERAGAIVSGIAGSSGVVEGKARVIMEVQNLNQLEAGEILVAPATMPAWTHAFGRAKAVVTDQGGVLGHAAIVAREYGIPAVVNTKEGTKKIKTGSKIRVDGTLGAVYLVS